MESMTGRLPRVLLRDVAGRANVSDSTAPRALADDPRIGATTRALVKAAAADCATSRTPPPAAFASTGPGSSDSSCRTFVARSTVRSCSFEQEASVGHDGPGHPLRDRQLHSGAAVNIAIAP